MNTPPYWPSLGPGEAGAIFVLAESIGQEQARKLGFTLFAAV
jgi:hypothetical protein